MQNLCVFHILSFSSSFQTITVQNGAFSSIFQFTEAATGGVLLKKLFSKISQISQEKNLFWILFLIKLQAQTCNFVKKRLQHRYFPVKFAKFLRTPILKNICERLLLNLSGILPSSMKRFQTNIQTEKPIFKMAKSITRSNILNGK